MASDTEQQMQTLHFICISVFALTKNEIKVQNNFFNPLFSFLWLFRKLFIPPPHQLRGPVCWDVGGFLTCDAHYRFC